MDSRLLPPAGDKQPTNSKRPDVNIRIVIPPGMNGMRLDILVSELAGVSRRLAKRIIDFGAVRIEGKVIRQQSAPVFQGLRMAIRYDPEADVPPPPVDVVLDDPAFLVVNKPAGQPVQGTRVGTANSLEEAIRTMAKKRYVPYIVHRLDMPVSGLLIVPKGDQAAFTFSRMFEGKGIAKTYLGVVAETTGGQSFLKELGSGDGQIHASLLWINNKQKAVISPTGKKSQSVIRHILNLGNGLHLLAIRLVTGRTHQARAHLASVGLPLVGDRQYGSTITYPFAAPSAELPADTEGPTTPLPPRDRIALHAAHLRFDHPTTSEPISLFQPPPPDFWPPGVELLGMDVFPDTLRNAILSL